MVLRPMPFVRQQSSRWGGARARDASRIIVAWCRLKGIGMLIIEISPKKKVRFSGFMNLSFRFASSLIIINTKLISCMHNRSKSIKLKWVIIKILHSSITDNVFYVIQKNATISALLHYCRKKMDTATFATITEHDGDNVASFHRVVGSPHKSPTATTIDRISAERNWQWYNCSGFQQRRWWTRYQPAQSGDKSVTNPRAAWKANTHPLSAQVGDAKLDTLKNRWRPAATVLEQFIERW